MVYKAAVQILKKADDLKHKLTQKCDLLNDDDVWTCQQQLQTVYHQVLVLDLEYALDKKVEQELWTLGFKNHITALQELSRDKKNPKRSESQALLSWCLEAASGFYLTLLQEFCTTFSLDLPFRRKGSVYGQMKECPLEQTNLPQTSSSVYICQYCLVHLGDIARYRNQRKQSESFYKQAILVSPTSGHPYNQLALLEASQGNKLSTVFHYVRSIAVKNPFPAATTNLMNTLSSAIDKKGPITENNTKLTLSEFIHLFLCVHGLLHTASDLDQAEMGVKILNSALTALVATESFTAEKLLEMTAINFYALWHVVGSKVMKTAELTQDELKVRELVLDLLAGSVSAFLIPVHTLKADESLLEYYALPAVKFLLTWIQSVPELLHEKVFSNRLQIWPSLCKLLNNMQPFMNDFNCDSYKNVPVPEDREFLGFIPFMQFLKDVDFTSDEIEDKNLILQIRARRLIDFGLWVCGIDLDNKKHVITSKNTDGQQLFEPACMQPDPTESLLEEMRSVNLVETNCLKGKEKRGGILKPQGSLEKNREEREQVLLSGSETDSNPGVILTNANSTKDSSKFKRVRQNVALQSIFKKMEESKQVKFNVSAAENEEETVKLDPKTAVVGNHSNVNTSNVGGMSQPLRMQSFSQNHPALPSEMPADLLNQHLPQQLLPPQKTMPPFPLPNQNTAYTSPALAPPQRSLQQNPLNIFSQPPPVPYQNVQYPQFSPWKQEERSSNSNAPWWPGSLAPNQNYPPSQEGYQLGPKYSGTVPYVSRNSAPFANLEYASKPQNGQSLPGYSPWRQQRGLPGPGAPYDSQTQGLSMRQVLLKEAVNSMPSFGSQARANVVMSGWD